MVQLIMIGAGFGLQIAALFVANRYAFRSLSDAAYQRIRKIIFSVYLAGGVLMVTAAFI